VALLEWWRDKKVAAFSFAPVVVTSDSVEAAVPATADIMGIIITQ